MKHGKKYVEAAKVYDKQTQYDRDVMLISRSVVP